MLLKENVASQVKFLVCTLHRFVMHRIVSCYAFGVSREITEGLLMAEEQRRGPAQARGRQKPAVKPECMLTGIEAEQMHAWKADTLRALFEAPGIAKGREQALRKVTQEAWDLLELFFTKTIDREKVIREFHNRITVCAWELNRQLRTSPVKYRFDMSYVQGTRSASRDLYEADRKANTLMDADTGRKVKISTEIVLDRHHSFGRELCVIFPGLVRVNAEGRDIRVGKATLLVSLNKRQTMSGLGRLIRSMAG